MSGATPPLITTERLLLRGHEADDLDIYAEMWAAEAVIRHTILEPRTRQDAWMTLCRHRGSWALIGFGLWAVERRDTGAFIGEAGFMQNLRELEPDISDVPEAGWAFLPSVYGQGYASEACAAIHAWLDRARPGTPAACLIHPDNAASIRVAEKCGYALDVSTTHRGDPVGLYRRSPAVAPEAS